MTLATRVIQSVCKFNQMNKAIGLTFLSVLVSPMAFSAPATSNWNSANSWSANEPSSNTSTYKRRPTQNSFKNPNLSPFSPGSNNLAIDIGQIFLMGDLGNQFQDAIGMQVHYTYGVSDIFGFDASVGYSSHSDSKFSMTNLLAGLRTNLSWYDKVIPHAIFGLGFYKPSFQINEAYSISPILFGIHIGPGVDLEITKNMFFGASVTFHDIFGTTRETPKGDVLYIGGAYTNFLAKVGFTF